MLFCFWDWPGFCKIIPVWNEVPTLRLWRAGTMMKEKTFMLLLSPRIWKAPCAFLSGKLLQEKSFWGQKTSLEDNDSADLLAAPCAGKLQGELFLSKDVHCPQCGAPGDTSLLCCSPPCIQFVFLLCVFFRTGIDEDLVCYTLHVLFQDIPSVFVEG